VKGYDLSNLKNVTIGDPPRIASKMLDLRIPKGTFGKITKYNDLIEYAASKSIKLVVKEF